MGSYWTAISYGVPWWLDKQNPLYTVYLANYVAVRGKTPDEEINDEGDNTQRAILQTWWPIAVHLKNYDQQAAAEIADFSSRQKKEYKHKTNYWGIKATEAWATYILQTVVGVFTKLGKKNPVAKFAKFAGDKAGKSLFDPQKLWGEIIKLAILDQKWAASTRLAAQERARDILSGKHPIPGVSASYYPDELTEKSAETPGQKKKKTSGKSSFTAFDKKAASKSPMVPIAIGGAIVLAVVTVLLATRGK
jgi:hypothetical protein